MGDKLRGIYDKFRIERTDGKHRPGREHDGCTYFVLDVTHDPFVPTALLAYADACEAEYPALAADCRRWAERPDAAMLPEMKTCQLCGGQQDQRDLVPCLVNGATIMAHWSCAKNANTAEREEKEGVPDEPWP